MQKKFLLEKLKQGGGYRFIVIPFIIPFKNILHSTFEKSLPILLQFRLLYLKTTPPRSL